MRYLQLECHSNRVTPLIILKRKRKKQTEFFLRLTQLQKFHFIFGLPFLDASLSISTERNDFVMRGIHRFSSRHSNLRLLKIPPRLIRVRPRLILEILTVRFSASPCCGRTPPKRSSFTDRGDNLRLLSVKSGRPRNF